MGKKPIGDAGPLHIQGGAPPTVTWQKIKFPEEKEDQEKFIAESFARQHAAGANYALKQLPQDDFDFNLEIGGNSSYLELMEMMFPGKKRGPPYADNEQKVQSWKYANTITEGIQRKRYKKENTPTNLLLYVTHWRFIPNETVKNLVKHFLATTNHPFADVFIYMPITESEGITEKIFPVGGVKLTAAQLAVAKENSYLNADPARATPLPDGSVRIS